MKLMIDNQVSEKQNIINHINQVLPATVNPIAESDVNFSLPREIVPNVPVSTVDRIHPNDHYVYNTEITVSSTGSYSWEQAEVIGYRRIDLGLQWWFLHKDTPVTIDLGQLDVTEENILNKLIEIFSVRKDSLKVEIRAGKNNEHKNVVFTPIENSLLYIGSLEVEYKVKPFVPPDTRIDLDDVFGGGDIGINNDPNASLTGLEYHTRNNP